jgi:glycosyltransferase involved in cell wall biosynthesis
MDILKKPPHIAIYLHCLFNGGIERVILNLTRNFIARGVKVDLVLNFPGTIFLWDFPPEVRIINLEAEKILTRVPKLVRYLRQEQPTALMSANHYANEVAIWAKHFSGVPTRVVVSEHTNLSQEVGNTSPLTFKHWSPLAARLFYPWADGIVAVSQGVAEDIVAITNLAADRIQVINNPIETDEIFEKAKEPVDHPWFDSPELPVIIGVGRLEKQKNFSNLINAFVKVRQVRPARLMILGEGSERDRLEDLIRELGLQNEVAMPGFVRNPFAYMARAAVFVLSSSWEGRPVVLGEVMALGTPIVSTNCKSGPYELLDGGKYGDLVPVDDSEALAQAILKVLSGEKKLADPAWLAQFNIQGTAQKYLDILGITEFHQTESQSNFIV